MQIEICFVHNPPRYLEVEGFDNNDNIDMDGRNITSRIHKVTVIGAFVIILFPTS